MFKVINHENYFTRYYETKDIHAIFMPVLQNIRNLQCNTPIM